jgi:hypothetical protein
MILPHSRFHTKGLGGSTKSGHVVAAPPGGDIVVDIREHVKHLAALRRDGVWAQDKSDL